MGRSAQVKSIDALQSMSAALECFHDDAQTALDELELQIYRALQWINDECRQYWKQEVHRSWDRVTEAKIQLDRAMMFRRNEGQHFACMEEKKALEKAKRRLELAQSKVEAIKHWSPAIEHAVFEYRSVRTHLVNWLDTDFPRAIALLGQMTSALEAYVRLATPSDDLAPIIKAAMASPADTQAVDSPKNDTENASTPETRSDPPQDNETDAQGMKMNDTDASGYENHPTDPPNSEPKPRP
jgi:hypothetical protein